MSLKSNKFIIIITAVLIITASIWLASRFLGKPESSTSSIIPPSKTTSVSQNDKPQIVSTKPEPLENNLVSGKDPIEITFNRPLENVGEFKVKIEPKIDFKVELSGDRKTAKITPAKPYPLDTTFTLFIGSDTKFDGAGSWGENKDFHFRTIRYTGV